MAEKREAKKLTTIQVYVESVGKLNRVRRKMILADASKPYFSNPALLNKLLKFYEENAK
jgi:hypothetical protein